MKKPSLSWKKLKPKKPDFSKEGFVSSFTSKAFRAGGYSVAATAVVLAIAVTLNLFVNAMPSTITKIDATSNQMFTISEQTEKILTNLEDDIQIYWIVQSGEENSYIEQLLDRYTSLSKSVSVTKRDPVVYPNFAAQYTDESISNNSLIVVRGEQSRYISYSDIFVTDYSNYYYDGSYTTEFDGEAALTSAISYVTSDDLPKIYVLNGHGEGSLSSDMSNSISKDNIEMEDLSLLTEESVPEDADALFILSPQSDISTEEKEKILEYLQAGGNMLLVSDYTEDELPNLTELMAYYGVEAADGIVVEGDSSYSLSGYAYYLLPSINSHDITSPLVNGGYYVLMPVAQGIIVADDTRDTLSVTSLLTTSDDAFSKLAGYGITTYDKEAGDIDGPFALGVAITDTTDDGESKIVWYTSSSLLDSSVNQMVSGANEDLFLNSVNWMCEREESISIHAKSMSAEYLTITSSAASSLSFVLIGVIPILFIGTGIYVMIKRRRR